MFERLARLGALHGIDFRWEGRSGNSRDSHKLILLAMEQDDASSSSSSPPSEPPTSTTTTTNNNNTAMTTNPLVLTYKQTKQERTITHLFASAFEQGQDLSSRAFLAGAAVTLGLVDSREEALAYLEQEADQDQEEHEAGRPRPGPGKRVDESSARARQIGMTAVPSYVVQGRWYVFLLHFPPPSLIASFCYSFFPVGTCYDGKGTWADRSWILTPGKLAGCREKMCGCGSLRRLGRRSWGGRVRREVA
jgi:predicted DsbA family dithiol-disulfide isomerase